MIRRTWTWLGVFRSKRPQKNSEEIPGKHFFSFGKVHLQKKSWDTANRWELLLSGASHWVKQIKNTTTNTLIPIHFKVDIFCLFSFHENIFSFKDSRHKTFVTFSSQRKNALPCKLLSLIRWAQLLGPQPTARHTQQVPKVLSTRLHLWIPNVFSRVELLALTSY